MNWKAISSCMVLAAGGCVSDGGNLNISPNLVGSDFCEIQRQKLSWDIKDTRETIQGIRRFNAKWDRRCRGATS